MAIVIPSPLAAASRDRFGRARIVHVSDNEIRAHNGRVGDLCVRIGRQLGMTASEQRVLARSGLLHDIGKLAIPGSILHKHDPLDDSEWKLMRTHPEVGLRILQWAGKFERALLAVLYHHERMDGRGYPHGLVGDAIPIEARVVAVADLTNPEALSYVQERLRRMGIERALHRAGAREGDVVRLGDVELEYVEGFT